MRETDLSAVLGRYATLDTEQTFTAPKNFFVNHHIPLRLATTSKTGCNIVYYMDKGLEDRLDDWNGYNAVATFGYQNDYMYITNDASGQERMCIDDDRNMFTKAKGALTEKKYTVITEKNLVDFLTKLGYKPTNT